MSKTGQPPESAPAGRENDGAGRDAPGAPASGQRPTAQYIAELTKELAGLARAEQLDFLAHLLDIAQLEAASTERRLSLRPRRG